MNKVGNIEGFSNNAVPLENLSEEEKKTPSGMYSDEITAEPGEENPDKTSSEENLEQKTETPEEEIKQGADIQSEVQEKKQEIQPPVKTPKSSDDTEDIELKGLKAQQEKLKEQNTAIKQQLLDDIMRQRDEKRKLKSQLETQQPEPQTNSQSVDEEGIDPEIASQLDSWATKKGLVPEAQIREKIHKEALDSGINTIDKEFFNKYPEYLYSPELRNEHEGIVSSLKQPSTADEYQKNIDIAHSIIRQNHPDRFPSSSGTEATKKQAISNAGLGAGSQSAPSSNQPRLDPAKVAQAKRFYKGYTDEEIMNLLSK